MSQYSVFLPPKLVPFPLDTKLDRVSLKILDPPPSHANFSQSSLPIRQARILNAVGQSGISGQSGVDGQGDMTSLGRIADDVVEDGTPGTQDTGIVGSASQHQNKGIKSRKRKSTVVDTSRRRSTRLTRSAGSLLGTLPPLDESDSFLSFNTTATDSNPSQFPPPTIDAPGSSLHNLPSWYIPVIKLSSLSDLLGNGKGKGKGKGQGKGLHGLSVIVCVVGVERARVIQTAEEKRRGQVGSLWVGKWEVVSMREGEEEKGGGEVGCGVQLWDLCARDWGEERVRRGDVVLLENVEFRPATARDKDQIVVSTKGGNNPKMTVLYRTLPRYLVAMESKFGQAVQSKKRMEIGDKALRPDLRLGRSDLAVRRVAENVEWFAQWVGGEGPH